MTNPYLIESIARLQVEEARNAAAKRALRGRSHLGWSWRRRGVPSGQASASATAGLARRGLPGAVVFSFRPGAPAVHLDRLPGRQPGARPDLTLISRYPSWPV